MWNTTFDSHLSYRGWLCFLVCLCTGVCTGCISDDDEEGVGGNIMVGDTLPEFSITMNDGRVVSRETLRGKPSCIVFFNTSCGDCRAELPVMEQVYRMYGEGGDVTFLAVSREESAESVLGYWTVNELSMPFSAQGDRGIYNLFASSGIPRIYISDGNLRVRAVYADSPLATEEELKGMLRSLLP